MVCKLSFLSNSCSHQKGQSSGGFTLKNLYLGKVKTAPFKDFLLIPLSKEWYQANDGKPIVFDARLTLNGKLVLTGSLSKLVSTKEVDTNAR